MSSTRRDPSLAQQTGYARQAVILRKNLTEWDRQVGGLGSAHNNNNNNNGNNNGNGTAEDWPRSLGRLNAALNQTVQMDQSISDVMEHFVYVPIKAVANPGDIPFFLSTRLEDETAVHSTSSRATTSATTTATSEVSEFALDTDAVDAVQLLADFETTTADLAAEYDRTMVRF
jgi:hypothetical protein